MCRSRCSTSSGRPSPPTGRSSAANAHHERIDAFTETDFTEDLKVIDVPVLVAHGTDDQIVPYADSAPLSADLLKYGTLKTYDDSPTACRQLIRTSSTGTSWNFLKA